VSNANNLIVRGIRGELKLAQDGIQALKDAKDRAVANRDSAQQQLDAAKAVVQQMTTEISDAQQLIVDLQAEIAAVQARP
jgi:chromosome segregation ATPase